MGWRNPSEISEFEIHAEAYMALRERYKNVRGQYHYKKDGHRTAIFDAVLLDDTSQIQCVIEVKRANKRRWGIQKDRYEAATGKPCVLICGHKDLPDMISRLNNAMKMWDVDFKALEK